MENIMVCVTKQKTCQRLIDYGKQLMHGKRDSLHIIHVTSEDSEFLGDNEENRALEFLYEKSREAGAELTVLKSDDVIGTLDRIAGENHITKVVCGSPGEIGEPDGFLTRFHNKLNGKAELIVVPRA